MLQNELQAEKLKPACEEENSSVPKINGDDEKIHMPYYDNKLSASRCKSPDCKQLTHAYCGRCQKHLCFNRKRNCFQAYHGNLVQGSNGKDEKVHLPYHDLKSSASRCKLPKCKNLTHAYCNICQKNLCFSKQRNCFAAYHDCSRENSINYI